MERRSLPHGCRELRMAVNTRLCIETKSSFIQSQACWRTRSSRTTKRLRLATETLILQRSPPTTRSKLKRSIPNFLHIGKGRLSGEKLSPVETEIFPVCHLQSCISNRIVTRYSLLGVASSTRTLRQEVRLWLIDRTRESMSCEETLGHETRMTVCMEVRLAKVSISGTTLLNPSGTQ